MTLPDEAQFVDVFVDIAHEPFLLAAVMELRRNADLAETVESCARHAVGLYVLASQNEVSIDENTLNVPT